MKKNNFLKLLFYMCSIIITLLVQEKITYAKSNSKYEYDINNGEITITKYIGNENNINVPSSIDGLPVTKIEERAFEELSVKTIRIPKSVESISKYTFDSCDNLTGVIIGNGVIEIPKWAFYECDNLKYIIFGKNVSIIDDPVTFSDINSLEYMSISNGECKLGGYWYYFEEGSSNYFYDNYVIVCEDNSTTLENVIDLEIPYETLEYANVTFVNGDKTLFTVPMVKSGTVLNDLYSLNDTSTKQFIGWYTSPTFDKKVKKTGNDDITVYARFEKRPEAPVVKVSKISNKEYKVTWNKEDGYYYQLEVKNADYRASKYDIIQKYKKNISSYTAKVSSTYDKYFRVKCYKVIDGVKVYSNYSKSAYSSKPSYPAIFINWYELDINSVGGVDNYIFFTNNSSKIIKYITFTVTPYNRVDDKITCDITDRSSFRLKVTGPIKTDEFYTAGWDPVWYNWSTSYAKVIKAEIIYMDGTKKNITLNKKSIID